MAQGQRTQEKALVMDYSTIDAKLNRAIAKINDLDELIRRYRNLKPYAIRVDEESRDRHKFCGQLIILKNHAIPEPDTDTILLAGEILYQLRSALDHLICQLVIRNGFGHTIETHRRHQFPIFETPEGYRERAGGMIWNVPKAAEPLIEREQPYQRTAHTPRNDLLFSLNELNNTDKHRLLPVVVAGISAIHIRDGTGKIGLLQSSDVVLEHNKMIWRFTCQLEPEDHIRADLATTIAFQQAMSPYGVTLGMDSLMLSIATRVGEILNTFKAQFP